MENYTSKQEFTARQKQILSLVRKGLTNQEICRVLNISANTVKVHLANIYRIMDVSNRTEAVSLGMPELINVKCVPEIKILVIQKENFDNPKMNMFAFLMNQNLQRYNLFQVLNAPMESRDGKITYQVILTGTLDSKPTLYLSLYDGTMTQLLWAYSQKINEHSDIDFLSNQMTMLLYRQMLISAAKSFDRGENLKPNWWYVSAFVNYKLNCRNRESFEKCECELQTEFQKGPVNTFVKFSLVRLYYTAITEMWVELQMYIDKIQELACSSMRDEPYSVYSRLMMALYNILSGNKKDAITYLLMVTKANPENIWASILLSQSYLLMGEENKALELLDECERVFPDLENDPNQIVPKSLIYFLLKKYDECEKYALRAAYIRQESVYPLLLMILCRMVKDDVSSADPYKKMLFKYHPDFKISDCTKLLNGINPDCRKKIEVLLKRVF